MLQKYFQVKNDQTIDALQRIETKKTLNIIVNDIISVDIHEIDFALLKNGYFMCLSNKNQDFVDEVYNDITLFGKCQDVSIRDGKIGKFQRFERIFKNW